MIRQPVVASALLAALALGVAPAAHAGGWTYHGPHGATVSHWGGPGYAGHPCCYGVAAVAAGVAGLAVGTAVGVAAASHPAYVAPPPVVYAPPPVVYAPPPAYYVP